MKKIAVLLLFLSGCSHHMAKTYYPQDRDCPVNSRVDYCEWTREEGMKVYHKQTSCPAGEHPALVCQNCSVSLIQCAKE